MWYEKRLALLAALRNLGHTVLFLSRPTQYSKHEYIMGQPEDCDLILMEFGSDNEQFYGEDILPSRQMLATRKCIFLLDDPELMPKEAQQAERIWVNARNMEAVKEKWGSKCEYMPFAAIQTGKLSQPTNTFGIYIGSATQGREVFVQAFQAVCPTLIFSREGQFKRLISQPPPPQPLRYALYGKHKFSLGLRDKTHKKYDWNTGRQTHSVMAGTPFINDDQASWQQQYDGIDLDRAGVWAAQYANIKAEQTIAEAQLASL
jgi:hypothetical protein